MGSTRFFVATPTRASSLAATRHSVWPSGGSSIAKSSTARGVASSRRGCGRSSRLFVEVMGPSRPTSSEACAVGIGSSSTMGSGDGPKRVSRRSGIRGSPCWVCVQVACPPSIRRWCAPASGFEGEEVLARGDWAVRLPGAPTGGWAFEYDNVLYPDVDDAAVVALALEELGRAKNAVARACDWIVAMQSSNGGWGAFDVDNDAEWLLRHPVLRFRCGYRSAERRCLGPRDRAAREQAGIRACARAGARLHARRAGG